MQRGEFLNTIKDVRNVLLGNGFSLSHPKFGNHFDWNKETAIVKNIDNIFKFESRGNCESDLSIIRKNILKLILRYYLENLIGSDETKDLKQVYNKFKEFTFNPYHCTQFLSNRENIFTLNYDPILYFEALY